MNRLVVFFALVGGVAQAAPMNKCVDSQGHVTFTQQACAGGLAGEPLDVRSASGGMSLGPSRQPDVPAVVPEQAPERSEVNVVGGTSSECGGGSEQDVRSAVVRKQVYVGMTAKQAQQSWGAPGKINRSSGGSDQWVYYRGDAVMQFIYVDQAGCVTAWN